MINLHHYVNANGGNDALVGGAGESFPSTVGVEVYVAGAEETYGGTGNDETVYLW